MDHPRLRPVHFCLIGLALLFLHGVIAGGPAVRHRWVVDSSSGAVGANLTVFERQLLEREDRFSWAAEIRVNPGPVDGIEWLVPFVNEQALGLPVFGLATNNGSLFASVPRSDGIDHHVRLDDLPDEPFDVELRVDEAKRIRVSIDEEQRYSYRYDLAVLDYLPTDVLELPEGTAQSGPYRFTGWVGQDAAGIGPALLRLARLLGIGLVSGGLGFLVLSLMRRHLSGPAKRTGPGFFGVRTAAYLAGAVSLVTYAASALWVQSVGPYGSRFAGFAPRMDRFSDYWQLSDMSQTVGQHGFATSNYPPGVWLFMKPLTVFSGTDGFWILATTVVLVGVGGIWFALGGMSTTTARIATTVLLSCTAPVLFAADRGNLELVVAIVLMSAVYAFASGRHHVAAVLIGIATALKVIPVLFVLLFVRKGTRRGVISLVISASMATIAGAILVGGLDNIANYSTALGASQDAGQRVNENLLPNNWSIVGFAQQVWWLFDRSTGHIQAYDLLAPWWPFACLAVVVAVAYWIYARSPKLVEQLIVLGCLYVLLPPLSYQYRGSILLLPLLLAATGEIRGSREGDVLGRTAQSTLVWVLLGLVLAERSIGRLPHTNLWAGDLPSAVLLLALLVAVIAPTLRRDDAPDNGTTQPGGEADSTGIEPTEEEIDAG